ncbi:MAG: single-stranded DNA-binding protein [Akkermansiaceae bacterium]|nr:single-stranded DNA-binding protein [Akkermansiaceae bacterium]MCP5545541.1 single-stranded DNA-binding protein [Akkermansiaceae bacterium]MCP5546749.1 single-stranded DNA-binding protein [Akkermansiaceae bacterium]
MASLNKVLIMGNLTRDPELRYTPKGTAVADIGLAVNRRVSDGNGNWSDETTFIDVTLWGRQAELAQQYLTKGRGCFVEGRLQLDTWDDRETGKKRSKLKVVGENLQFLPDGRGSSGGGGGGGGAPSGQQPQRSQGTPQGASAAPPDDYQEEDDIPF